MNFCTLTDPITAPVDHSVQLRARSRRLLEIRSIAVLGMLVPKFQADKIVEPAMSDAQHKKYLLELKVIVPIIGDIIP